MLQKTKGIVLSHTNYSETSIICKIYTEVLGLRTYMVNGVRSARAKNKSVFFQPLTLLDMVVYERDGKGIQRIKEHRPVRVFQAIPFDVIKSGIALFMTEVLMKVIGEEEGDEKLFSFLEYKCIGYLEEEKMSKYFPLYFLMELSRYLGFYPHNNYESEKYPFFDLMEGRYIGEEAMIQQQLIMTLRFSKFFSDCLDKELSELEKVGMNRQERKAMLDWLIRYYRLHISNFEKLQSLEVLEQVWGGN